MLESLTDPRFVEAENDRVLTMVTALYVRSLYPDLTVAEVFDKLEDVEFVKQIIYQLVEEINESKGVEVLRTVPEAHEMDDPTSGEVS